MKITGRKQIGGASPIHATARSRESAKIEGQPQVEVGAANVHLSNAMQEVDKARQAMQAMADVRVEKINELKPIVEDGSYHVESKVLAKKIVDASLRESAQLNPRKK